MFFRVFWHWLLLLGLLSGLHCHSPRSSELHAPSMDPSASLPCELIFRTATGEHPGDASYQELMQSYATWNAYGEARDGYRLSIAAPQDEYAVGEAVGILHVVESLREGAELHPMGPKTVSGVYINDSLAGPAAPDGPRPWIPLEYDGRVLSGPGLDCHFLHPEYRFDAPGTYAIQWRQGSLLSNVLTIHIRPR